MKCVQEQRYFTRFLGLLWARIKITGNKGFKSYLQQFSYFHAPLILQVFMKHSYDTSYNIQSDLNSNVRSKHSQQLRSSKSQWDKIISYVSLKFPCIMTSRDIFETLKIR